MARIHARKTAPVLPARDPADLPPAGPIPASRRHDLAMALHHLSEARGRLLTARIDPDAREQLAVAHELLMAVLHGD